MAVAIDDRMVDLLANGLDLIMQIYVGDGHLHPPTRSIERPARQAVPVTSNIHLAFGAGAYRVRQCRHQPPLPPWFILDRLF